MAKFDNPDDIKVIVATDCGSTTTKAILIEFHNGEYRLMVRGEAPGALLPADQRPPVSPQGLQGTSLGAGSLTRPDSARSSSARARDPQVEV